jgi:hypothetical protein
MNVFSFLKIILSAALFHTCTGNFYGARKRPLFKNQESSRPNTAETDDAKKGDIQAFKRMEPWIAHCEQNNETIKSVTTGRHPGCRWYADGECAIILYDDHLEAGRNVMLFIWLAEHITNDSVRKCLDKIPPTFQARLTHQDGIHRNYAHCVVYMPNAVSIESDSFKGRDNFREFYFNKDSRLTSIGPSAFAGTGLFTIELPSSVESIDDQAFSGCRQLKVVKFQSGSKLTFLGDGAFFNTPLEEMHFPKGLNAIGRTRTPNTFFGSRIHTIVLETANTELMKALHNETSLPSTVSTVIIKNNVEEIANAAFAGWNELTTVHFEGNSTLHSVGSGAFMASQIQRLCIPKSVRMISAEAFVGCPSLTNVEFERGSQLATIEAKAFAGLTAMQRIIIPKSVRVISAEAFVGCKSLTNVEFERGSQLTTIESGAFAELPIQEFIVPRRVTEIRDGAFAGCKSLTNVEFEDGSQLTIIGEQVFAGLPIQRLRIPKSVQMIHPRAFAGCLSLANVGFEPDSQLTTIESGAFAELPIQEFIVLRSVTEIRAGAFAGCQELAEVIFQDGSSLTRICPRAFYQTKIASLKLPNSVTHIDKGAFAECIHLSCIEIDSKNSCLKIIGEEAFIGTSLSQIIIPRCVIQIGKRTFYKCPLTKMEVSSNKSLIFGEQSFYGTLIASLKIPSFSGIDQEAFSHCLNLEEIELTVSPNSTEAYLGVRSFAYTKVKSINVPKGVTDISAGAFGGCTELARVTLHDDLIQIGSEAFLGTALACINIPRGVALIGTNAFAQTPLAKVNIETGSKLSTIKDGAFVRCCHLVHINLNECPGLTSIGPSAFQGSGLQSVVIPGKTSIGKSAFQHCHALATLKFLDRTLDKNTDRSIDDSAFADCTSLRGSPRRLVGVEPIDLRGFDRVHGNSFARCQPILKFEGFQFERKE